MKFRFLSLLFLLTGALLAGNYRPPDMEKELFKVDKLEIRDTFKTSLFAGLLSVARDFDEEENEVEFDLRSNALAIAGRLDPDSVNFKDVLKDLEQRSRSVKEDGADKDKVVSKLYRGIKVLMREDENKDNLKCASYCIDIALRLSPDGKYQSQLEEYQKTAGKASWKGMLGDPVENRSGESNNEFKERTETIPGGKAEKFAANQAAVYGLSVRRLANGRHAGAASSLSATALRSEDVEGIEFHIDQKVGNMTGNSLEEIKKLMRIRHEEDGRIPSGYRVEIAFEDKDGLLDGPSAGTAMSLILDSLFTGNELDGKFAVTGAITADGKVTPIGGVAGKIRGATRKGCTLVGVPHENIKGVADILVLDGIDKIMAIQVFSFETLDQALMVASKKKPEDVQSTIDDFNKIAELIKSKGESSLKDPKVVALLEEVVKKMPNHQSAKLLLSVAKGEEKKKLSLGGSFHQINTKISGIGNKLRMAAFFGKVNFDSADRQAAKDSIDELSEVTAKLDPRLNDYNDAIVKVLEVVSGGREDGEDDEDFQRRLKKRWEASEGEMQKLRNDPEIMEELNGQ